MGLSTITSYSPLLACGVLDPCNAKHIPQGFRLLHQAEESYTRALSLPLYPAMSDADVEKVIQSEKKIGKKFDNR